MLKLPHFVLDIWQWRQGCQPYALATTFSLEDSWYSFLLEAVDRGAMVWLEGLGQLKKNPPYWDSNLRPSGL
jgi:hypothetical protein